MRVCLTLDCNCIPEEFGFTGQGEWSGSMESVAVMHSGLSDTFALSCQFSSLLSLLSGCFA